jgi:hypothetical protein
MNINDIISFESGELDSQGVLEMFSAGIKDGSVWQLQGCYGRTARDLISMGFLSRTGEILVDTVALSELEDEA